MKNYFYEVRFPNNSDPTFSLKFSTKVDALEFANQFSDSEVYLVEINSQEYDDENSTNLVKEVQIKGPLAKEIIQDGMKSNEDSCASDNPDNYVNGEFRAPKVLDDLDEPVSTQLPCSTDSSATSDLGDDMTDEELGEALFSKIQEKICKVNPVITHTSDDDQILKEDKETHELCTRLKSSNGIEYCFWCGDKCTSDYEYFDKNCGFFCPKCWEVTHDSNGELVVDL